MQRQQHEDGTHQVGLAPSELRASEEAPRKGLSLFQGVVSLINILVGLGLLSMPYALRLSGSFGVLVIVLCCVLFNASGKFIAWGLDTIPDTPSSHIQGYPELGKAAFGQAGKRLVTAAATIELFGGSCMMFIVLWATIQGIPYMQQLMPQFVTDLLPEWLPVDILAVAIGVLVEVPLILLGSFKSLANFAAAGVLSTGIVTVLVGLLPLVDPHREWLDGQPSEHQVFGKPSEVFSAAGIMALSVAGHSCFPSVRASMADAKQFPAALNISYVIICTLVSAVAGVGYWYWGESAHVLVTDDFALHSPYMNVKLFGIGIRHIVELMVIVNVATTLPLLVLPLEDIVMSIRSSLRTSASADDQYIDDAHEPLLIQSMHGITCSLGSSNAPETLPAPSADVEAAAESVATESLSEKVPMHVSHASKRTARESAHGLQFSRMAGTEIQDINTGLERMSNAVLPASREEARKTPPGGRVVRAILITIVSMFAFTFRESLPAVESIVGAVCLVFSSMLLPTLFYLGIRKKYGIVGWKLWAAGGLIMVFGGGLMTLIILQTIQKIVGRS